MDYFSLTRAEINAINQLTASQKKELQNAHLKIGGFNIGMNCGESAGQTVFHCHVHLIARRTGDVENPRGGVRHLIPGKGHYEGSPSPTAAGDSLRAALIFLQLIVFKLLHIRPAAHEEQQTNKIQGKLSP